MTSLANKRKTTNRTSTLLKILFFLLATTWLAAPFIHGQHVGHLQFISDYEGVGQTWSWLFRASDFASSIVLIVLASYHRLLRKKPWIFWLLIAYAVCSALDSFFPLDCRHIASKVCISRNDWNTLAHYAESVATPLVGLALIAIDILKQKRQHLVNGIFLALQVVLGTFMAIGEISGQAAIVLEYIYEVAIALWLAYFFEAFEPETDRSPGNLHKWYRNGLAIWVGLAGVLEIIVAAAHLHLYGRGFALYFGQSSAWLAQQGAIVGVLLLYLARQIQRGERRAAYALIVIFGFELFNYSLVSPHRGLAIIYELLLLTVFLSRKLFDRNIGQINLYRRLNDLASLVAGVAVALAIIIIILASVGRLGRVENILSGGSHFAGSVFHHSRHYVGHHDRIGDTLVILISATVVIGAWALFRPYGLAETAGRDERARARELVKNFAGSSEDYFKLWPLGKSYFFSPDTSGFIAYKVVRGTAFALADPIADDASARARLLTDFANFCHQKGWTICFLPVEETHKKFYADAGFKLMPMGANALVETGKFERETRHNKWWRWKLNRAAKAGYTYEFSQPPHRSELLRRLGKVSNAWLASGGRREQGFALGYFDEYYLNQCLVHYVRSANGKIIAFANQLPVYVKTQTTVDLIRYRPGEDAAMPFLLASMIEQLTHEGEFSKLDLGFVPLAQLGNKAAKLARAAGKIRFSAAGLEQFKSKFDPDWQTNYLAYSGDIVDLAALALKLESALKP